MSQILPSRLTAGCAQSDQDQMVMKRCQPENTYAYAVTAIVPCRNERDSIERCVLSILGQEQCNGGIEIIVADGLSDDGTPAILNGLALEYPSLRVLTNPKRTMPSGVNFGIQAARGRYIAIMGAHNRYAPDYLRQSVQVLEETHADNVGGSMICEGRSHVQRAIALAHHSTFSVGGARWHNPDYEGPADTVFGGVYRREVFERIGLFDEELVRNQDDEFNLRLVQHGGRIWHSPRIRSWYSPRQSLTALFRQYVQYGYWRVRVIQKRKAAASRRQFVPGVFVFLLFALPLAGLWWRMAGWAWVGLVAAYLTSSVAVSLGIAARESWRFLWTLPVVFACYHVGYGVGTLRGIVDFVFLKRAPAQSYSQLTRSSSSSDHLDAS
jgi:glycosyltransferase involved in cell wall biosynthesis